MTEKLIEVKDLEISFGEGSKKFVAVKNANFFINKGETFSLVGESGSGKTTIGRAIIGLNDTSAGDILYDGKKINGKQSRKDENELIRKIQMIFQDPAASLNERATVDYIISEGLYNYHLFENEEDREMCIRDSNHTSKTSDEQKSSTKKAILNKDFRQAITFALNRENYSAQVNGKEYAKAAIRNMYTAPVSYTHLDVYKRQALPQ